MRRILTIAGLAVVVAAPSLIPVSASAGSYCDRRAHERKVTGALLGAIGGGLLGNAVSSGGGRTGGTLIGAGLGAVVGNNLARINCDRRVVYRTRTRTRAYYGADYGYRSGPGYGAANYRYAGARSCRYETRPFYDVRGRLVYAPTQVCG
jgi:uncharacterized protein YcfJ